MFFILAPETEKKVTVRNSQMIKFIQQSISNLCDMLERSTNLKTSFKSGILTVKCNLKKKNYFYYIDLILKQHVTAISANLFLLLLNIVKMNLI